MELGQAQVLATLAVVEALGPIGAQLAILASATSAIATRMQDARGAHS